MTDATTHMDLMQRIDALVEQRTLSVEAAEAVVKLREEVRQRRANDEHSTRKINELNMKTLVLEDTIKKLVNDNAAWQRREDELRKREAAITQLEKNTAVAEAKASVVHELFDKIFKVPMVRERVQRSVSAQEPVVRDGFVSTTANKNTSETVTTERVEE